MRFFICFSLMMCVSCGSAKDIATIADAMNKATATATPGPDATPDSDNTKTESVLTKYQKISRGMKREEIVAKLGEPTKSEFQTFCDNGKCSTYEYLSYLYDEKKIGVTIEGGVATFTYLM